MEKTNFPRLDSGKHSLDIIKAFMPDFYEYLRMNPKAVTTLLKLQKENNKKAGEIITYLIGTPPTALIIGSAANKKYLQQEYYKGNAGYDLSWSDFRINDRDKDKPVVEFDFEAVFDEEQEYYHVRTHILTPKQPSVLASKFLLLEVAEWLKEKNYKLRRADPVNNKGMLSPYVRLILRPIDWRENPERPDRKDLGFAKTVKGECSVQILPLS